jgi:hypothetical protein
VTPPGIDPGTVRLVAQRLNHYATPGPAGLHGNFYRHNINQEHNKTDFLCA